MITVGRSVVVAIDVGVDVFDIAADHLTVCASIYERRAAPASVCEHAGGVMGLLATGATE